MVNNRNHDKRKTNATKPKAREFFPIAYSSNAPTAREGNRSHGPPSFVGETETVCLRKAKAAHHGKPVVAAPIMR